MVDPKDQAAFVAALRKKAAELAAGNPVLADIRLVRKSLVDEARRRYAGGSGDTPIGAYMMGGVVSILDPEATEEKEANTEILSKLRKLTQEGTIQAAGICQVIEKQIPGGNVEKFVKLHMEHSSGKALVSLVLVDESVLMKGVPGVNGPAVGFFGGPTSSKIFHPRT